MDEALEKAGILLGLPGGTQLSAQLAGLAIHEAGQPSQLGGAQQGPDVVGTLAFFLPCAYQASPLVPLSSLQCPLAVPARLPAFCRLAADQPAPLLTTSTPTPPQEGELLVTVGGETECIELSSKNASNSRVAVLRTGAHASEAARAAVQHYRWRALHPTPHSNN